MRYSGYILSLYLSPFSPLFLWKLLPPSCGKGSRIQNLTTGTSFARKRASYPPTLVVMSLLLYSLQETACY